MFAHSGHKPPQWNIHYTGGALGASNTEGWRILRKIQQGITQKISVQAVVEQGLPPRGAALRG
jgi:hypothetical protein